MVTWFEELTVMTGFSQIGSAYVLTPVGNWSLVPFAMALMYCTSEVGSMVILTEVVPIPLVAVVGVVPSVV